MEGKDVKKNIRKLLIGCFLFIVLMALGGDESNNMGLEMAYAEEGERDFEENAVYDFEEVFSIAKSTAV